MNGSLLESSGLLPTQQASSASSIPSFQYTKRSVENSDLSEGTLYVVFAVNGALSLVGLMGNLLVCVIIICGRKMYTIANLFLLNLAIADICVLIISYPLWVLQNTLQTRWPFGAALCKIVPSVSDAFYGVSLGCITAISIHRYRMILHAMETQMSFLQAKVAIVFIWLISIGTISVPLYPAKVYVEHTNVNSVNETDQIKSCYSGWPSRSYERSYQLFLFIAWYALPLVVILWTFLRIRVYLRKQMIYDWLSSKEHSALISNHVMGIKRALRMLAPVVVVFSILMLPWNMLRLVSVIADIWALPKVQIYVLISGTMLVANSTVNPFIYYIMSKEFRQEFRKQFWFCRRVLGLVKSEDEFVFGSDTLGRRCIRRMVSVNEEHQENGCPLITNSLNSMKSHGGGDVETIVTSTSDIEETNMCSIIRGAALSSIPEEECTTTLAKVSQGKEESCS